jgi:hypothetical protein
VGPGHGYGGFSDTRRPVDSRYHDSSAGIGSLEHGRERLQFAHPTGEVVNGRWQLVRNRVSLRAVTWSVVVHGSSRLGRLDGLEVTARVSWLVGGQTWIFIDVRCVRGPAGSAIHPNPVRLQPERRQAERRKSNKGADDARKPIRCLQSRLRHEQGEADPGRTCEDTSGPTKQARRHAPIMNLNGPTPKSWNRRGLDAFAAARPLDVRI